MAKSVKERIKAIEHALTLIKNGKSPDVAWNLVADKFGANVSTLRRWFSVVKNIPREEWNTALQPKWGGGPPQAKCSQEAWEYFLMIYDKTEPPSLSEAYSKTREMAKKKGWDLPSNNTIKRRMAKEGIKIRTIYDKLI